jgi:hypothetical protein
LAALARSSCEAKEFIARIANLILSYLTRTPVFFFFFGKTSIPTQLNEAQPQWAEGARVPSELNASRQVRRNQNQNSQGVKM